jgi:hypothetical protein
MLSRQRNVSSVICESSPLRECHELLRHDGSCMRSFERNVRAVAALIVALGLAAVGVAILSEKLGLGAEAARGIFGWKRLTLLLAGATVAAIGALLLARPRIAARLTETRGGRSLALLLTAERRRAFTVAWRAFWASRLLIWSAGIVGVLAWSVVGVNAPGPDTLGGVLVSPASQWDAGWFVPIAQQGYEARAPDSMAFFPLYPLLIRIVGEPIDALGLAGAHSFELAGTLVSLCALIVALYLLHRLTDLELGARAADNAVALLALFPTSFYLSAIYSESLFLALTIGCVYSGRRGWWGRVAVLGALATATRSQGALLLLPLAIMLWYGPRADRGPVSAKRSFYPRFRPRPLEVGAVLLVPVGLLAYIGYVWVATKYAALTPFEVQELWHRELKGPIASLWGGARDAVLATRDLLAGLPHVDDDWATGIDRGPGFGDQFSFVRGSLLNFAALVLAGVGVAGALRRLPIAYGAYALAALIVMISFPHPLDPLYSLPRFILVLFPAFMWAGLAMTRSRYARNVVLAASAAALVSLSTLFALGYWIA